jgi:hypothetical protein
MNEKENIKREILWNYVKLIFSIKDPPESSSLRGVNLPDGKYDLLTIWLSVLYCIPKTVSSVQAEKSYGQ